MPQWLAGGRGGRIFGGMSDNIIVGAAERRAEIRARAAAMGIDEAYISRLVDAFYGRIREHEVLGPIFNMAIGDNWDHHLGRMKQFWASVALNAGSYSGRPVPVHRRLRLARPEHFEMWLGLFKETLAEVSAERGAPEDAADYFMERAERIGESLKLAMFGVPELGGRGR